MTLRARLMTVAVIGAAVALALGSVILYAVLTRVSYAAQDRSARATADQVIALDQAGPLPDVLPVTGSELVQVVDSRARVVTASASANRLTPLLTAAQQRAALRGPVTVSASTAGLAGQLRVRATAVPRTDRTVLVAEQVDDIVRSARQLKIALALADPLLILALALVCWRVVSAALRPVERLRAGAERVSGAQGDGRLPVPDTDDEIRALAVTLNSMLARLSASRARHRGFVADVAHELRTPISSMLAQLEVAQRLGEGGAVVDDLHAEALRMAAIVEDLLVLARLDADAPSVPAARPVEVAPVCAEVLAARTPRAGVEVLVPEPGSGLTALTDRDELLRVVGNLVDNALRHARSRVEVSAVASRRRVRLRVDDDGAGVPPADRERVFERFTRLDEARDRDAGGSGLGLAIVKELVELRGGSVLLDDAPAGGLRVDVDLPAGHPGSRGTPHQGGAL